MKQVGIITFHNNFNFGAALQCAAVCELVRKFGGEPRVIDYSPYETRKTLLRGWNIRTLGLAKALRKRFLDTLHGREVKKNFDRFRDCYWEKTPPCRDNQEIAKVTAGFSHLITGSDQVWRFDRPSAYFLEWGSQTKQTKISYAPCCTGPEQPGWQTDRITKWLKDFDYLSVRNDFSRDVVEARTGRTPEVVADPTLLVDFTDHLDLPADLPEKYILVYALGGDTGGGIRALVARAKTFHPRCKIVAISPTLLSAPSYPWADLVLHGLGPFEWVALIRSSELLITDSFHGIIFGVKNDRPVIGYHEERLRAPRLHDLAKRYALESRIVANGDDIASAVFTAEPSIETKEKIAEHRMRSEEFLARSLVDLQ